MAKRDMRRLLAAMHQADVRKKAVLLVNNDKEEALRGTALLTDHEIRQLLGDIRRLADSERRRHPTAHPRPSEVLTILDRSHLLLLSLVVTIRPAVLETTILLVSLQREFAEIEQYGDFGDVLSTLCVTKSARFDERLIERVLQIGQSHLVGSYLVAEQESDGITPFRLNVPNEAAAWIFKKILIVKQRIAGLKGMIQCMRDFMRDERIPICVIAEGLDEYESTVRELISHTKRILYHPDFEGWEEARDALWQSGDQKLAMMEALPDYDDVPPDQAAYDEMRCFLKEVEGPCALFRRTVAG